MRNKWYVAGILLPALLLIWGAIHAVVNENGLLLVLVPAGLAVALLVAAVKVGKADSFAPKRGERWGDSGNTPDVQRWLQDRADPPAERTAPVRTPPPTNTPAPR